METLSNVEKAILARFFYAQGNPIMEDGAYDDLIRTLTSQGVVMNPIYEDDLPPVELLERIGLSPEQITDVLGREQVITDNTGILDDAHSLSIASYDNESEAYEWFKSKPSGTVFTCTPKIDGINTKTGYSNANGVYSLELSLSRGNASESLDYTGATQQMLPNKFGTQDALGNLIVYGEGYVTKSSREYLNSKYVDEYKKPLKTDRGMALSMLRRSTMYAPEDYEHLHILVFRTNQGNSLAESIDFAKQAGFETVPYITEAIDTSSFASWQVGIKRIMDYLLAYALKKEWVLDGVVVEVNDRNVSSHGEVQNNYSSENRAMKFWHWKPGEYIAQVVDIEIDQQNEASNCVAIIDTVTTSSGKEVRRVNLFNPAVLLDNEILVGSYIKFIYKNETTVDFVCVVYPELEVQDG